MRPKPRGIIYQKYQRLPLRSLYLNKSAKIFTKFLI